MMAGAPKSAAFLASLSCLFLLVTLSGCADLPHIPKVSSSYRIPSDFRIVGYFPSWSGDPEYVDYPALTHICYAFDAPTPDGDSYPLAQEEKLYRLMALAHRQGTKVLLSFAATQGGSIASYGIIAADPALTQKFVIRLEDLISRYNLDGIDIDMEFPDQSNAQGFASLVHAIAIALHQDHKELSLAVSADNLHGQYYLDSVLQDADFINIMAYDDGFGQAPDHNHSSYAFARGSLDYWLASRKLPREKAVLGVPFYGRSLSDRHSISYYNLRAHHWNAAGGDSMGGFGYNGFDTLRAKTVNLARYRASGIMVWQLNQDANDSDSLLNAIFDAVKEPRD